MSDPQAQMLQEAIGRAQSRAQILHSLQENFKNKKIVPINTTNQPNKKKANNNNNSKNTPNYNKNSNNNNNNSNNHQQQSKNQTLGQGKKRKEDESEAPSSSSAKKARKSTDVASFQEIVDRSIGILLKVAGTSSDRNREYFRENISNKTIVLESTKKVAKAANRMKRQQRRMKKLSARQQRRRGLCETLRRSYGPAETEELLLLAALFEHYLAHLLDSCASSLQLQVRLAGAELVGAELLVVDATPRLRETVGLAGIVIGRTASLVFLFLGHLPGHGRTSQEAAAEEAENQPQRPPASPRRAAPRERRTAPARPPRPPRPPAARPATRPRSRPPRLGRTRGSPRSRPPPPPPRPLPLPVSPRAPPVAAASLPLPLPAGPSRSAAAGRAPRPRPPPGGAAAAGGRPAGPSTGRTRAAPSSAPTAPGPGHGPGPG